MADDAAQLPAPVTGEISSSRDGRDITVAFMGDLLDSQDRVLRTLRDRWEAYREIRRDGQVHATFQQRRLALASRPVVVEPGAADAQSVAAAEQLQLNLDSIAFNRATKGMHWGVFYGYSVGECMWGQRDGKIWLETVKVRTPWRFRFDQAGKLRLLTRNDMWKGEEMPDRKFWTLASGADNDDDPYGLGLAYQLWWPVYFKKQGLAFWLRALEKFGGPTAVGKYPPGSPPDVVAKLLAACLAMRIDGAVAIPEDCDIELKEASRGTVDQSTFNRQMNSEISKIVIGQTMTTDDGASLSQSQVHQDVKEEVTDADDEEIAESFEQGPARWLTEWNFPGAAIPRVRRPSPEDQERAAELAKKRADTIKTMGDAGYEPEEATLKEMFPGWRPKPQATAAPAAGADTQIAPAAPQLGPAFAEADPARDAIDPFVEDLDWEQVVEPIAVAVERLVLESPSLEAAADRLVEILTGEADQALREDLARAMFQAALAGQGGLALSPREARVQRAADRAAG